MEAVEAREKAEQAKSKEEKEQEQAEVRRTATLQLPCLQLLRICILQLSYVVQSIG